MRLEFAENTSPLPLAVTQNLGNGNFGVVIKERERNAAEKGKGRDVAVAKRQKRTFIVSDKRSQYRLSRVSFDKTRI